eukprot:scaffold1224_cov191-Pinguiococcus_pyrenoidosus.AAC.9
MSPLKLPRAPLMVPHQDVLGTVRRMYEKSLRGVQVTRAPDEKSTVMGKPRFPTRMLAPATTELVGS